MKIEHAKNINYKKLFDGMRKEKKGRRSRKTDPFFYGDFFTFDIETTNIQDIKQGVMYIWQVYFNGHVIIGRKWSEFIYFIEKICTHAHYNIVCYVHNLSFEFAYIRELFRWDDVKILKNHTILTCSYKKITFKCSYLLTHMSLDKFTEKMNVQHKKLKGDIFDYNKKRYWNTHIKGYELLYCVNDVVGLHEALTLYYANENKNIYNMPLTSTGFVRKELKQNVRMIIGQQYARQRALSLEQYIFCHKAFRGGNTHANKFYTGQVLKNIYSVDIKSSYPAQICLQKYPVTPFSKIYEYTQKEIEYYIQGGTTAILMCIDFESMKLKDRTCPCPYISLSKIEKPKNFIIDNGRVLICDSGRMYITDIDYKIIAEQYSFDCVKITACMSKYGYIPIPYIKTVLHYFELKENLKKEPYYYMRAKEKLNAIYGVLVTAILRDNIKYKNGEFITVPVNREKEIMENKEKNVLLYQFGVWVTAWGRYELQKVIDMCGQDFVYCDTDSVKFKNHIHLQQIEKYNTDIRQRAKERGIIVNDKVMGVFELETCYKNFVTLGAKKYAYTDRYNTLSVTVSGVRKGAEQELKNIKRFKTGFCFKEHGGTEGRYNDFYGEYYVNEHLKLEISENLYLNQHEYILGHSKDYKNLLDSILLGEYEYLW